MTENLSNLYQTQHFENIAGRNQLGRTGVSGGWHSTQLEQTRRKLQAGATTIHEDLDLKRQGLLNQIAGIREGYMEDLYGAGSGSVYSAFQQSGIDPHIHEDSISSCYQQGKVWAANPEDPTACRDIDESDIPSDWDEVWGQDDSFFGVSGCTDTSAQNYNPDAVFNDGSCYYPEPEADAAVENQQNCEESGGSWDYDKQECEYGVFYDDDHEISQCSEAGGMWNWGNNECDMPDHGEGGEEAPSFEVDGLTFDLECPSGLEYGQDGSGYWGCIDPNFEGHFLSNTAWTEEGSYGSQVDSSEIEWAQGLEPGLLDSAETYEMWFGGPHPELGYTAYYCWVHPYNPECGWYTGG